MLDPTHDVDLAYEQGHADGGNSIHDDWYTALAELLPEQVLCRPTEVADYVRALQERCAELVEKLSVLGVDT